MFSTISNFITSIGEVGYEIPYYYKAAFLTILIVIVSAIIYIFNDMFKKGAFRDTYVWYYVVIIVNLINILLIVTYYNIKKDERGPIGLPGKKGAKGDRGKFLNCGYCDYTLFFQKTKRYNTICKLTNNPSSTVLEITKGKFKDLIEGNNVSYSTFLGDLLLKSKIEEDKIRTAHFEYATLISNIMFQKELILQLYTYYLNKEVNFITNNYVGKIMRPYSISGYMLLGDTITGAHENFKLNSFIVAPAGTSESMYPVRYKRLISFNSYDPDENRNKQFTIWRGVGQEVSGVDKLGKDKTFHYHPIGDICTEGSSEPDRSALATIHENCLELADENSLNMVAIYFDQSSVNFSASSESPASGDYNNITRDFTIDKPSVNIELCSLWRTPLNTFVTNYINSEFKFENNSIAYNLIGGKKSKLDAYRNVTMEAKREIISRLKNIKVNKLQIIFILVNHYSHAYMNELRYYLYRVDSGYSSESGTTSGKGESVKSKEMRAKVKKLKEEKQVDFTIDGASAKADSAQNIGEILKFIEDTEEENKNYNKQRSVRIYKNPDKPHEPRKIIPTYLTNVVKKVKNGLLQIDSKIDSIETLYDLVRELFDGGLNFRVAVDNEGVAMGGELINFAQEILLYICKIVQPPDVEIYNIKSECVGTNKIDKEKRTLTTRVERTITEHKKLMNEYKTNPDKYCSNWKSIIQYQDLSFNKLGQHFSHIKNYAEKIERMELEEFTKSRLKLIAEEYEKLNKYIKGNCGKDQEYEFSTEDLNL